MSKKPNYRLQVFSAKYSDEFSFITSSTVSKHHAFCKVCRRDISISHGGRTDIVHHAKTQTHSKAMAQENSLEKNQPRISNMFTAKVEESLDATRAECLFAAFYVEHNIPIAASDHMGKLLRRAFPKSEEVKKFRSARTKTTHIIKEMAKETTKSLRDSLKLLPFSLATDGSHTSDAKLYPIVITVPDQHSKSVKTQLLSVPVLTGPSTGDNIGHLLLNELQGMGVPITNCISMGSDNANVMLGKKNGVISVLREEQSDLIALGCPCHLINLAAHNAASALPVSVDSLLIDLYYYMENSVNRKLRLKEVQDLFGVEVERVLKHSTTRWLSLGQALPRLLRQWDVLSDFLQKELSASQSQDRSKAFKPIMQSYSIPKVIDSSASKRKASQQVSEQPRKKIKSTEPTPSDKKSTSTKLQSISEALSSNVHRAYCHFLQYSISSFEKTNTFLQSRQPLIHKLNSILTDFLKGLLASFLKPSAFEGVTSIKYVNYTDETLHKDDIDISIGNSCLDIVEKLDGEELIQFFLSVKNYYLKACNYIVANFPIDTDILKHAEVADVSKRSKMSFTSVRFFTKKFTSLVQKKENESIDDAMDILQEQFNAYVIDSFDDLNLTAMPIDELWFTIALHKDCLGQLKYDRLAFFMLGLLTIPHSNAECERTFSQVRKNKTDFRGSLTDDTLSALIVTKSSNRQPCFETDFSNVFLKKIKSGDSAASQDD